VRLRLPDGDIHHEVATAVAELWARAGIDTQIIQAPLPEHWQALYEGDFDVAFVAWPGRRDTPRDGFAPISRVGGPWNFPRYGFPDFSDRLDRASESLRDDVRASHYREAEKALIEDQSLLALFFYRPLALVSLQVRGWQTNTVGIHPLATLSLANRTQKLNLIRPIMPRAFPSLSNTP
jgi:ABC-type transport system substrate-binding protein